MKSRPPKVFLGLDCPLICEHKTAPLWTDPNGTLHNHDGYELFLFLEGCVTFFSERGGFSLEPGSLLLIPPHIFHRAELKKTACCDRFVINVREELMKEISTSASNLASCFSPEGAPALTLLRPDADTFRELVRTAGTLECCLRKKQFGDDVLANACLVQFMVTANRILPCRDALPSTSLMPAVVSETFAYIEHHLSEDITLSGLAAQLHHNGDYISRCFKKTAGISLQQFIITKRLAVAQRLLREGRTPGEACRLSGFRNYCNFSRTFSGHTGCSPGKYRSSYQIPKHFPAQ